MTISITIGEHLAKIAVMHSLHYGRPVNTLNAFKDELSNYVLLFGKSCVEDHEIELLKFEKQADRITKKYWR